MKVLVFAKQIPDVNKIQYDPETNRIVREGVPLSMNSFDKKAVEEALRLKEKHGFDTIVASMGPPQASEILNEALRMGCDSAYLITDRKFGGSDTLATSRILSALVAKISPDLILMGKYSLDGETSQVPPEVAVFSGFNFRSSVSRIELDSGERTLTVDQDRENGVSRFRISLPAVLSVSEKINRARAIKPDTPDMSGRIQTIDSSWLGIDLNGKDYSPTVVVGTERLESSRKVSMLDFSENVFRNIVDLIRSPPHDVPGTAVSAAPVFRVGQDSILVVAVGDPRTSIEIASKSWELAAEHSLNVEVLGNIEPGRLEGILCHRLHHIRQDDYIAVANSVLRFIEERKPKYVIFPSNTDGRDIAGTVAARLSLGLTADCVDLKIRDNRLMQYKPAFGGGIIASIYSRTSPEMATVRPGMFRIVPGKADPVVDEVPPGESSGQTLLEHVPVPPEYVPLGDRRTVIGIGRGVKKREIISAVLELAGVLNASVGATRPVVDMNFVPRQQQIGLTGASISPDFYLALGISGQANHVVGIRYAGTVMAVNSDPNADIFRYADFGVVADVNEFISGLMEFLKANAM